MATNKYTQKCQDCGEIVFPGKGILSQEWSNQDDDVVWVVRHEDKNLCESIKAALKNDADCKNTIYAVSNYIKTYGEKSAIQDGNEIIWDGRHGYNSVGWLITRDEENNLYITSRSNLDGDDMSATYILGDGGDEGYGNSNDDIISALHNAINGKPSDIKPFTV